MCGIVGVLRDYTTDIPAGTIGKMVADISHRGPDDEGMLLLSPSSSADWQPCAENDPRWTVALGSRRLSILDVSHAGHMPMVYRDRFWITYNGEVYNFIEIRAELEKLGHTFRSSSDTEVILAAYAEWGAHCFARLRGMWGMVIFDAGRNEVILCRDRMGIKPLYLWQGAGIVAIASEIKQFLPIPGFVPRMNPPAAAEYLQTGYEEIGRSFFRDVWPVPAGSWIKVPLATLVPSTPQEYWHPERIGIAVTDVQEASHLFADQLRESVRLHLRSDVPVGCALSGGLDSSAIAVIANQFKESQDHPLHTFSSTFPGHNVDERQYIDAVISTIRSTPHFTTPDASSFLAEFNSFLWTHDEPVGSLSVYASYCIARLTREAGIPVTLNGQGGDEILSGYWQSYFMHLRLLARQRQVLPAMQHLVGALTKRGNPALLAQIPGMLKRYRARSKPNSLVRLSSPLQGAETPVLQKVLALDEQHWRLEEIRNMFLPRLLKWDDRNSMAFSVEGRYPFLDHQLIELCLSFAPAILFRSGWTKVPLREGLKGVLPAKILARRSKIGFEVPQDEWLAGPLRAPLENWLKQDRPLWAYVERADVQKLASQVWSSSCASGVSGAALIRLFIFDRWLEVFGVV